MPAHRFVARDSRIKAAQDAESFVVTDTGGQVIPTGITEELPDGFRVECFSHDGRSHAPALAPAFTRARYRVISVSEQSARLVDGSGFEFECDRLLPPGVKLEVGQEISAVGSCADGHIYDVAIERGPGALSERREFESYNRESDFDLKRYKSGHPAA